MSFKKFLLESPAKEAAKLVLDRWNNKEKFKITPPISKIFPNLVNIPLGKYEGNMRAADCHPNSVKMSKQGYELYIGVAVIIGADSDVISFVHSFNVKESKVYEFTNLNLRSGENVYYFGVPVPKADISKFKYVDNLDKISWVKQQAKLIK